MSIVQPMTSFRDLLGFLRELVEAQRSGTLSLATSDNHSASFSLDRGRIVSVTCHMRKGSKALEPLTAIQFARYRFTDHGAEIQHRRDLLPSTDEILSLLQSGAETAVGDGAESFSDAVRSAPRQTLPVGEIKAIVEQEATEYLGPMAAYVCEEHFKETRPADMASLKSVLEAIAGELLNRSQAEKFKAGTMDRLSTLLG